MCLAIYVACEAPLPESAWDKNAPGFFLEQVQIFTCWEDEQTEEARTAGAVTLTQLVEPEFEFQQRTLLTVREEK